MCGNTMMSRKGNKGTTRVAGSGGGPSLLSPSLRNNMTYLNLRDEINSNSFLELKLFLRCFATIIG
jgi:hypothetical protein